MSAAAPSLKLLAVLAARRTRTAREAAANPFAPDVPLAWWYARLRYADAEGAPALTRAREEGRRMWHETGGQPHVSPETEDPRRIFPDFRGLYGTRAEARQLISSPLDCLWAFPYGRMPFGEEIVNNPTFCRPLLNEEQRRKDEDHARLYVAALEDCICPALVAENRELHRQLSEIYEALSKE
jgi:hypothetical protein